MEDVVNISPSRKNPRGKMPGTRCAVAICQNSLLATKKKNLNISYHTFPKDPKLCNTWINACRRKDEWNPKTSTICSVHFLEDQFEVDLRSQLMNIKTKKKLKTSVRANKRHNATIVKNLIHPTENNDNAQGDDDLTHEDQDKLYGVSPALIDESIEEKINSGPLKELLKVTRTEISVCHKLTQKHLDCIKSERQNVGLAAQLLSHSVATALIHYKPGPDKVLSENTGQFIETISYWFDIMNSYTPSETLCTKKPYGLNLEDQNNCLEKVYKLINSMRCQGKNVLQTFQKGILISIKSTQELFKHLNKKNNISYILTNRLNQDSLESFFSIIRSRGGLNDHPTPLNALYRIRIIVLGKNPGVVQAKQNIETQNYQSSSEEYLVANVIATADVKIDLNNDKNNGELSDSSLSSEDESAQKNLQTTNEEDGFIYLCGWLARKFKNKYPHLGNYTKDKKLEHSYSMPSWVHHLSFGGLTEPTDYWVMQAKQFENIFKKFHKEKVDPNSNIVKRLSNLIKKKFCDIPDDLIKAFVLQRTYIRIKQLNDDLMTEQLKRKRCLTSDRKSIKKMKKIIT
ncbi:hypothetical protein ACI65C_013284 [Semiaphis heraclei]